MDDNNNMKKQNPFPMRLHSMLKQTKRQGLEHVISWLPTGDAFRVHNIKYFANNILPEYFNTTIYKAFQRNLSWYGFSRVQSGPDEGAYKHHLFVMHDPTLCEQMRRPSSSTGSRYPHKREGETLQEAQALQNQTGRKKLKSSLDKSTVHHDNEHQGYKDMKCSKRTVTTTTDHPLYCTVCLSPFLTQDHSEPMSRSAQFPQDVLCETCKSSLKENHTEVFSWLLFDCGFPLEDLRFLLDPMEISYSLTHNRNITYGRDVENEITYHF